MELATARLFLALLPGEDVRAALATHSDAWQWNTGAAAYAPPDWHITLHFIGPVARQRLDELRAGLAVPMTPFELRLGWPALWPHGLAVLLPEAVPAGLQQLHDRLGQALQRLGLKTDARPYRPHFTLARHAALAQRPESPPLFDWHVEGYVLMESTGDAGQRYRVLQHYGSVA
ncbi:RNA 2',3'-cyclic phosphodiesterase [Rhodoferax sp. UBA5149]|uniref:RNA 2',3'-cyclic phosphodiesterase n=1 Tax=Rhodoferax sp. UBA5149 TaxID=1947379 RepID=UPI0025EBECCB|nr:RNA 2',3'-cyclic phosphodiesterase [Rhodoferax sp. UBA5149]